jgi:ketosteroid isomerase-like protein
MKKFNLIFVMLTLILLVIPACQTNKVDTLAEADKIRNLEHQWTAAIQSKDIDKNLSFFATEAVAMDPNFPIYVGLPAIRTGFETWFSDTTILFKLSLDIIDTIEVSASGDLAYVRGSSRHIQNMQSGLSESSAKWIDIWKKFDGNWKVIVNISNSDKPLLGE